MRPSRSPQRCLPPSARALVALVLIAGCAGAEQPPERRSRGIAPPPASLASSPSPPRNEVLALAWRAYACGRASGAVRRPVLGVIDYSLPSSRPRFWLIDARTGRVERSELVAHGEGSGELLATRFSNTPGSYRSSLGLFVTGAAYAGRYGPSLRLYGLEPGSNDAAYGRAIVVHGAGYATQDYVARFGQLGHSLGCPTLAPDVAPAVVHALADGAALFVYGDDPDWLARQPYTQCSAALARPDTPPDPGEARLRAGGPSWQGDEHAGPASQAR